MPSSSMRSRLTLVGVLASAALLALFGLFHATDLPRHAAARVAHHRALQTLDTADTLALRFHAKRDTMKIHGQSDFTVLAVLREAAVRSDVFEFNGIVSFVEGGATHTYQLVDGVTYYTKSTGSESTSFALPSSALPPVHELLEAFESATPIDKVETTQTIGCAADAQLFHARFSGMDFVLCALTVDGGASQGVRVVGEDFDVEIRATPVHVTIAKPASVTPTPSAATVPASTRRLSTATSLSSLLQLATRDAVSRVLAPAGQERTLALQAATCGCKTKPRPCIFFHGMDIKADGGLLDDYDFFGDIKKHAPCCSSVKFAVLNTVDYGWNNASLVDKACGYALSMSPTSDKASGTIEDTIVVAHSMGNLMIAHAEASGKCKLGASSSWVALSGPFKGSMGSDFQQQICDGEYFAHEVVEAVVALFGQCPQSLARQALTYEGGNFSSAEHNAQYVAAQLVHQKRVSAGVCGYSYNGLPSLDAVGLFLGGTILPHKSKENDGVVEFQSCIGNLSPTSFATDWSSPFYRAKLNHADTTFKHGDAWFNNEQKPVKWFECLAL